MATQFYTGMKGPQAIAKLNEMYGLAGDVAGAVEAAAEAAASAAAAAIQASSASAAATNAATSAGTSATQAAQAAAAATSAAAVYDDFDDRYLGPKAAAPTLDNDGAALATGALYFNTSDNNMYVRTATSTWATVNNLASSTSAAASATSASGSASAAASQATTASTAATNASSSATAAAGQATTASTAAANAGSSATTAASQAATASTAATNASTSATTAAYQATNASTSAANALTQANNASVSESQAASQSVSALSYKNLAAAWAEKDTEVEAGRYSAKYWAGQAAASITGQLIYRGAWSAASGTFPSIPVLGDYYKVTVSGTINSVTYNVGDHIIYNGSTWDHVDNTETTANTTVTLVGEVTGTGQTGTNIATMLGTVADIDFSTTGSVDSVARLKWNDGDGTLEVGLKGGNVTLQIGQEQVVRVYNSTGSTLVDGQVVYVTGAQGQRPQVVLASNAQEVTSSKTFGIVTESILAGAEGFVTTQGIVRGLNTSAYTEGQAIWLSTAGAFTATKPAPPAHQVFLGWVIRQHTTQGSIFVNIANGHELDELHDVLITGIQNNQVLMYETQSGLWKNVSLTKSQVGLANADNTQDAAKPISTATQAALDAKLSRSGGTMTGTLLTLSHQSTKVGIGSSDINIQAGNFFTKTIQGTTTFTVSNVPVTGTAASLILELTNPGSATITWWSGIKWAGGVAPTLTTSGVDILGFYTHDGGTTWRGLVLAKDSK